MEPESRHQCLIYEGPPSTRLTLIASILKRKLEEGYRCLYLNSNPMVAGMRSVLSSLGIDVATQIAKANLVLSSQTVLTEGKFNSSLMLAKLEDYLNQALNDGHTGLWASGDMSWEFGPEKDFSKLMEYELGLEELFHKRRELCGICQYHRDSLPEDAMRKSLLVHPALVINDTLTRVNPYYRSDSWPADQVTINNLDEMISSLGRERASE